MCGCNFIYNRVVEFEVCRQLVANSITNENEIREAYGAYGI